MKIKVIIFGLDGVICHTEKYHYLAWKQVTDELGIDYTENEYQRLVGMSRMDSLNAILANYPGELSVAEKEVLAEQKNQIFKSYLPELSEADLDEELVPTILQLKREGYLLAVASSSKNAGAVLRHLQLDDYFDTISDGNNSKKQKPEPEIYLNVCKFLNVAIEECMIVEGTAIGEIAAKRSGMHVAMLGDNLIDLAQLPAFACHIYK